MMRQMVGAALTVVWAGMALAEAPAEQSPGERLRDLLGGSPDAAFAPAFLQQVPRAAVDRVLTDLAALIGPVLELRPEGDGYLVVTETHRVPARIALDGEGRVAMLWFGAPEPTTVSLPEAEAQLEALGERVSWLALRDGAVLSARDAGVPLAVGSAFKIGVLSVLAEEIGAGDRDWSDVVRLEERHRSLPSGRMQDFPTGAPVTLHTAALAMIAESDNTATDLLIDTLGPERVAARLGLEPGAFLTTRAFFGLKADAALRERWLALPLAERQPVLEQATRRLAAPEKAMGPHDTGVEWYLPLERLCALAEPLADLPLMQVNPGPVANAGGRWESIAYKGGSETGVLSFVTLMRDGSGARYCAALAVNHGGEVDLTRAISGFGDFLRALP